MDNPAVELIWALRKVGHLLEQVRLHGEDEETVETITELAMRFGIVTPYTSLAWGDTDYKPQVADGGHTGNGGMGGFYGGGEDLALAAESLPRTEGAAGVTASKSIDELQAGVGDDENAEVQRAMGRAFYLRDGVWVDSSYDEETMTPTEITQASDEFFALLAGHPGLAEAFALGNELIVVVDGTAYRVSPAAAE